jgi:hypothetical protein
MKLSSSQGNLFELGHGRVFRSFYAAYFIEDMLAAGYDVAYDGNLHGRDYDGPFVQVKRHQEQGVRDATALIIRCERLGNNEWICFPIGWGEHPGGIVCEHCLHVDPDWRTVTCEECGHLFKDPLPFLFNEKRKEEEVSDAEYNRFVAWLAAFVVGSVVLQSLWVWIFG